MWILLSGSEEDPPQPLVQDPPQPLVRAPNAQHPLNLQWLDHSTLLGQLWGRSCQGEAPIGQSLFHVTNGEHQDNVGLPSVAGSPEAEILLQLQWATRAGPAGVAIGISNVPRGGCCQRRGRSAWARTSWGTSTALCCGARPGEVR